MLNLSHVIKPWKEADALSAHINLYGFWTETAFLTKSGDLGMVLSVTGVDYESLDNDEQQYAVKRLESALKSFGEGFHVYQYLFKTNRPEIPFARYDDELIDAAIDQRRRYFESKRDRLYEVELFYVIVLEGARSKTGIFSALGRMPRDPQGAIRELKAQFTNDNMKILLRKQIDTDMVRLEQCVQNFNRHLADLMPIEVQGQQAQFSFFRRLLNFDDWRIAGKPQSTQYLDFQVVNSNIEAERDHLRVGDHFVRILTMKEAIAETRPLVLDRLFKIEGNFYVVTEWTPLSMAKARKEVDKRRRHFNMSKSGFVSQIGSDPAKTNQRDVLIDESKQADIENLGECLRALGDGQTLGDFSLTVVLYSTDLQTINQEMGEFTSVFTNADGALFTETYNQLNALFAAIPGNYAQNLRKMYRCSRADLATLAEVGALNSIGEGSHRRDALWQVQRAGRQAGRLLESLDQDEEQTSPLQAMNPEERMVADYAGTGVTVGRHPMAHCRDQLRSMNVCRADDLRMLRHGVKARIAGCVIARQRPGTARGFIFLSIEDETGISNAIIDPELYERNRSLVTYARFLLVEGTLQNVDKVIHIRARHVEELKVTASPTQSHDFH